MLESFDKEWKVEKEDWYVQTEVYIMGKFSMTHSMELENWNMWTKINILAHLIKEYGKEKDSIIIAKELYSRVHGKMTKKFKES